MAYSKAPVGVRGRWGLPTCSPTKPLCCESQEEQAKTQQAEISAGPLRIHPVVNPPPRALPPLVLLPPEGPPAFVTLDKSTFSSAEALLGDMTQSKISPSPTSV